MNRPHLSNLSYVVPNLTVAAYSALVIALVAFGFAVAAIAMALMVLAGDG